MKKLSAHQKYTTRLMIVALLFLSKEGFAQPSYSFTGGVLQSGTNFQVGAVYKFTTVRTGVDAIVSITAISPGIGITELDGTSGYPATLQPTITAAAWTSGYVEMSIRFVIAGTNTTMNQPQLALTAIDVDGSTNYDGQGRSLHEFDQVNMGGGYVDFNTGGGELSISQSGNWFTGTNVSGIDYPGRDTIAQQVMFSVINTNVSILTLRVGVNNQTASSASRLRSVYFKKFNYLNSILAIHEGKRLKRSITQNDPTAFKIYPSAIQGRATISVQAEEDGHAMLTLVDYSGRVIYKQLIIVEKGKNNIPFFETSKISNGSYVALLNIDGKVFNQKIIKQL